FDADIGHLLPRPSTERATRCSDDNTLYIVLIMRLKTLENCAVLTVDWDNLSASFSDAAHKDVACSHQTLVVGEGDRCPSFCCCDGWLKAARSGNCSHHPLMVHGSSFE